jgi:hypothetical protein
MQSYYKTKLTFLTGTILFSLILGLEKALAFLTLG